MAASLASAAALCPRPAAARRSRCRRCAPVRAESGLEPGGGREGNFISTVDPAFDEVWDEQAGQMVQTLTQSVESAATPGLDWSYRLVEPHCHPSLVAAVVSVLRPLELFATRLDNASDAAHSRHVIGCYVTQ